MNRQMTLVTVLTFSLFIASTSSFAGKKGDLEKQVKKWSATFERADELNENTLSTLSDVQWNCEVVKVSSGKNAQDKPFHLKLLEKDGDFESSVAELSSEKSPLVDLSGHAKNDKFRYLFDFASSSFETAKAQFVVKLDENTGHLSLKITDLTEIQGKKAKNNSSLESDHAQVIHYAECTRVANLPAEGKIVRMYKNISADDASISESELSENEND